MHDHHTPRVATLPIRNGPAQGHRVTVETDAEGNPPPDVFVRLVDNRAVPAATDVRALGRDGWTPYASQRGPGGWELVVVAGRPPASN